MFRIYVYAILSLCTLSIILVLLELNFLRFDHYHSADPEPAPAEDPAYVNDRQLEEQPGLPAGEESTQQKLLPVSFTTEQFTEPGCRIPVLDPFDKGLMRTINALYYERPICMDKSQMKFWTDLDSTLIRKPGHKGFWKLVDCCYTTFTRGRDDMIVNSTSKTCYPITEDKTRIPPAHEFIRVRCKNKDKTGFPYEDFFGFVHPKPEVENRAAEYLKRTKQEDQLSIIILGLDSVSHMNFQRFMPNTQDFLLNRLSAIEFYARNKIGESTFANIVPTLTGLTMEELRKNASCWPTQKSHFDRCPFIWKDFRTFGYRTVYGEDSIHRSTFLHSNLNGFKDPIADYDFRTLIRGMESLGGGGEGCFRHQSSTQVLLDTISKAATRFRGKPYFHFTWIKSFTREAAQATKYVDDHVLSLLRTLKEADLLNNTMFVLMSDHGMTFGSYMERAQGRMESRMPMLNLVLPEWFSKKYSKALINLKLNSRRLSTPFDLHAMLKDLLRPAESISNSALERREAEAYSGSRGISLFLPIPLNRTCAMAGIDDHWCICWRKKPVLNASRDPDVNQTLTFSVSFMNAKLSPFPNCAQLRLSTVYLALRVNPEATRVAAQGPGLRKYQVVFRVEPSRGMFESTVILEKWNSPVMGGPISRLNDYKKQGDCIDTTANGTLEIKSMCYCLS